MNADTPTASAIITLKEYWYYGMNRAPLFVIEMTHECQGALNAFCRYYRKRRKSTLSWEI